MDYIEIQIGGYRANSRQGVALVDFADVEAIGAYHWSMNNAGYAYRNVEGEQRQVRMHREVLGLVSGDGQIDHVNGNKLDNRRTNLRVCTDAQNRQNLHNCPYRGTTWHALGKRWMARAMLDGKGYYLGLFDTREEAVAVAAAFRREHMPFSSDARN